MNSFRNLFVVVFILLLVVGCGSSRSGTSHSNIETNHLKETRSDSVDFKEKFAHYLNEKESNLSVRIVEFYPPEPGDTQPHGSIKSVTDLDLSSKNKSDSTIKQKQITISSETISEKTNEKTVVDTTYQVQSTPWYQPFIPYLVFVLIASLIYCLRRIK